MGCVLAEDNSSTGRIFNSPRNKSLRYEADKNPQALERYRSPSVRHFWILFPEALVEKADVQNVDSVLKLHQDEGVSRKTLQKSEIAP